MSKIEIKRFVNEIEPLTRIEVDGVVYDVFNPNDLSEKYYINYFYARAEIIDLANQYKKSFDSDVEVVDSLIKNIELQSLLIEPVKKMIESMCQVEQISARPKVLMEIYNYLETVLNPISDEGETGKEEMTA